MATDLDLQIVESVSAQVEQPGATTISAHTLFDIARKLPEGSQVSLHAAEGKMLIQAGRARFNLSTLRSEEHTSELQSLMRISYAVFCLTTKINQYTLPHQTPLSYNTNQTNT